ncbi:MAG TPA: hypothetical protein VD947_02915 [Patescibacteria group bacterium]|nr:hypothetical protein [Patescibacteria group bacterium]
MSEHLELHVVAPENDKWGVPIALLLLGETFHSEEWVEGSNFAPAYFRIPAYGGDGVRFCGGPFDSPEAYSPLVAELGSTLLKSPALISLMIAHDRIMPYFHSEELDDKGRGSFAQFGPRLVENIVEVITESLDRHVKIDGDPLAFEVADFRESIRS